MDFFDRAFNFWKMITDKIRPFLAAIGSFFIKAGRFMESLFTGVFKIRKIIAASPVAAGAIYLAFYNMGHLPEVVGIDLLENGSFTYQIPMGLAVFAPLAITGVCVLLMFCSRRILTPWLVSVFTLLIPLVILITNIFPA